MRTSRSHSEPLGRRYEWWRHWDRSLTWPWASRRAGRTGDAPDVIATPRPSPVAAPQRSQWERIVLEPGIELTVQRPLTRLAAKRVDRLVAYARELLIRDLADIT